MTERLPTADQFRRVLEPLQATRDSAYAVCIMDDGSENSHRAMKELCISRFKQAAAALGYELVERLPGNDAATARLIGTIDEAAEAPGGGRMDMEESADA